MEEKKYELTDETINIDGYILHRIKAIRNFGNVRVGELGGFIEKEYNLSHDNNAWISDNAKVYGNARVFGNANVRGQAKINQNGCIKLNDDYITFDRFGSRLGTTTMFICNDGIIRVSCGCFSGTLKEFRNKVGRIHGYNKYAKEYETIIKVAKIHFGIKRL